tara:strand:- start:238 stop:351 length:114 start_codon:yes stop_codon:yes gene_type:complete
MGEMWVASGIVINIALFIWGVLYLAKAIRDNDQDNFL